VASTNAVPELLREFLNNDANSVKLKLNSGSSSSRWCKPPPWYLNLNTDGSFHHDSHADAIGSIIRDFKGEFVAASTIFLPHISSPAVAKAMAM
jgi:hypothetical protein